MMADITSSSCPTQALVGAAIDVQTWPSTVTTTCLATNRTAPSTARTNPTGAERDKLDNEGKPVDRLTAKTMVSKHAHGSWRIVQINWSSRVPPLKVKR